MLEITESVLLSLKPPKDDSFVDKFIGSFSNCLC